MKLTLKILTILSLCFVFASAESILDKVASLKIGTDGYILGKKLTVKQLKTAKKNAIKKAVEGTYKFSDKDLFVIASKSDDRVIVMYKSYDNVDNKEAKGLFGSAMLNFGDPTAFAHDKLVYWSYDKDGKQISEEEMKAFKVKIKKADKSATLVETLKSEPVVAKYEPYVTIKLSCSKEITNKELIYTDATAYLIYSSNKLIEDMQRKMAEK